MGINVMKGNVYIENYVEPGATVEHKYYGPVYKSTEDETVGGDAVELTDDEETIVTELQGIFYGDKDKAMGFYVAVKSMKDTEICQMVKKLVKDKVISEMSSKKPLWEVLSKHGIYTKTLRNWNDQV